MAAARGFGMRPKLLQRDAGPAGDVAEVLEHRRQQGNAARVPLLLGLPLGIARDQDARRAGRRPRGPQRAREVVDLRLELLRVAECVDAHGPEAVADALPPPAP